MSHAIELFPGCTVLSLGSFLDLVCGEEDRPGPMETRVIDDLANGEWIPEGLGTVTYACFLGGFWISTRINPAEMPANVWKRAAFHLFMMEA